MDVPNIDDLEPEERQALKYANWDYVEKLSQDNTWTPTKHPYYFPGEIYRYIAQEPGFIDLPIINTEDRLRFKPPNAHHNYLLSAASLFQRFRGYVYPSLVSPTLRFQPRANGEYKLITPMAVRFALGE